MYTQEKTRPISPQAKLEQAIALAKSGQKEAAGDLFRQIVALQPVNQAAWIWLSAVTSDKAEAESALAQAKKIDPAHTSLPRAEQWFVHRFSPDPTTKQGTVVSAASPSPPSPSKKSKSLFSLVNSLAIALAVAVLLIGLLVLVFGVFWEAGAAAQPIKRQDTAAVAFEQVEIDINYLPGLDGLWSRQDWPKAIALLKNAHSLNPDSVFIKEKLAEAYLQQGLALRKKGFVDQALTNFELALAIYPEQMTARQEVDLASAYVAGTQHYQAGRWQESVVELERVWQQDKSYSNLRDLLYSANYNLALARQAAGDLAEAKRAVEAAITLRPDLQEPYRLLADIEFAVAPATPVKIKTPIEDRLILVGIAEQRMRVFEKDEQVFDFIVSTGEPGRETAVGEFEIQNKIDMAYASTWNLDMPYWMGIYWAGPLQNGIHALPVVKHTGYKLWDGYLGQRVSYGCVILSDEDAATLYDWTEVGTKVKIVPSLANWSPEE